MLVTFRLAGLVRAALFGGLRASVNQRDDIGHGHRALNQSGGFCRGAAKGFVIAAEIIENNI
jgi:hypothetical protein